MIRTVFVIALALLFWAVPAAAHEVRPAYLEITESTDGQYGILWKQPVAGGKRLVLDPVFPDTCTETKAPISEAVAGTLITRWQIGCDLHEGTIGIDGLGRTLTDVIVVISFLDGRHETHLLKPGAAELDLSSGTGGTRTGAYLQLGIEHILLGFDHLLFVAGLVLLASLRQLIPVATAFTVAHSLTLGATALGWISLPVAPVEILIAISIIFLAVEAVQKLRGETSLATRKPWLIAFGFGLLHGFGFATALGSIGLPKGAELIALLLFNVGVEVGQVLFIAVLLAAGWLIGRIVAQRRAALQMLTAYAIGGMAMFWTFERIAGTYLS